MCDVLENVADEYQIFIDVLSIVSSYLFISHSGSILDNFQNVDFERLKVQQHAWQNAH